MMANERKIQGKQSAEFFFNVHKFTVETFFLNCLLKTDPFILIQELIQIWCCRQLTLLINFCNSKQRKKRSIIKFPPSTPLPPVTCYLKLITKHLLKLQHKAACVII